MDIITYDQVSVGDIVCLSMITPHGCRSIHPIRTDSLVSMSSCDGDEVRRGVTSTIWPCVVSRKDQRHVWVHMIISDTGAPLSEYVAQRTLSMNGPSHLPFLPVMNTFGSWPRGIRSYIVAEKELAFGIPDVTATASHPQLCRSVNQVECNTTISTSSLPFLQAYKELWRAKEECKVYDLASIKAEVTQIRSSSEFLQEPQLLLNGPKRSRRTSTSSSTSLPEESPPPTKRSCIAPGALIRLMGKKQNSAQIGSKTKSADKETLPEVASADVEPERNKPKQDIQKQHYTQPDHRHQEISGRAPFVEVQFEEPHWSTSAFAVLFRFRPDMVLPNEHDLKKIGSELLFAMASGHDEELVAEAFRNQHGV